MGDGDELVPGSAKVASRHDLIEEIRHWKARALTAEAERDRLKSPERTVKPGGYCGVHHFPTSGCC